MQRGLTVEIDLQTLKDNLKAVTTKAGVPVIAVVKADAYGHGMVESARALEQEGVYALGVAYLQEAITLREAGLKTPILVFFDRDFPDELIHYDITPVVNSIDDLDKLSHLARRHSRQLSCHINIDTGMGRTGVWYEDTEKLLSELKSRSAVKVTGIMSHFSEAELAGSEYCILQIERFRQVQYAFQRAGFSPIAHMANSWAVINYPEASFGAVRVGLILYGGMTLEGVSIRPVMSAQVPILQIRKLPPQTPVSYGRTFITTRTTTVGVLPVGYADGLMRALSNNTHFFYRGRRVPVIGRICMDLTIVDLTEVEDPREGDSVTILGGPITAEELARASGTISYEILTSLGRSKKKTFREGRG